MSEIDVDSECSDFPSAVTVTEPTAPASALVGDVEAAPRAEGETRRGRPLAVAALALGLVAVAAVGWAVTQRRTADRLQHRIDKQRDAVLVATGFVKALMSYDNQHLDAQQAAVNRFATKDFRDKYSDAFTKNVRDQILSAKASSTVTVERVYVDVDDGQQLVAVVHALSHVTSGAGSTADLESYLRVRLVYSGARWNVDDLTSLGSRDLSAPPSTAATTTTSVPGG